jgi:hypothetical protein
VGFVDDGKSELAHREYALEEDDREQANGHLVISAYSGTSVPHNVDAVAGLAGT